MLKLWFSLFYWLIVLSIGGGSIHWAANKMRRLALEAVARPWPSLKMELKQNNKTDPFIIVKQLPPSFLLSIFAHP